IDDWSARRWLPDRGSERVEDCRRSNRGVGDTYRSSGKTVAFTTTPRATPARTCAVVWSPTWTRDQAITATRGQTASSAGPKTSSSTVGAPAAIAGWTGIFHHRGITQRR